MKARRAFRALGLIFFVFISLCAAAQMLGGDLISRYNPDFAQSPWYFWTISMVPLYLFAAPLSLPWLLLVPTDEAAARAGLSSGPAFASSRLTVKQFFTALIICFAFMYPGSVAGNLLSSLMGLFSSFEMAPELLEMLGTQPVWMTAAATVVIAPVLEELIFRKLLLDRVSRFGERNAVLFSGFVFGFFHCNTSQFFYATLLGFVFAYVYLRTRRVRYTMLLHACVNLIGGVVPSLILQGIDLSGLLRGDLSALSDALPRVGLLLCNALLMIGLCAFGVVVLIKRIKKGATPARGTLSRPFVSTWLNAGCILYVIACVVVTVI